MPPRAALEDSAELTPDERLSLLADIFIDAIGRIPRPISAEVPHPDSAGIGLEVPLGSRPDGSAAVDAAARTERCP